MKFRDLIYTIGVFLLISIASWSFPTYSLAQRAIPDDNLAYPVLITLKNGNSGSGFYLNTDDADYLVTAKHVIFTPGTNNLVSSEAELLSYPKDPTENGRYIFSADLSALQAAGNIKSSQSEDIAVVKLFTVHDDLKPTENSSTPTPAPVTPAPSPSTITPSAMHKLLPVPGVTNRESATSGLLGVSLQAALPFDQVLTGNDVIIFGYPSSLGLQQSPQFDSHRPLLRKGIVAGKYAQGHVIIIDCPVYPGNSGGPVLQITEQNMMRHYSIIGLASEFVPYIETRKNAQFGSYTTVLNSGYSVVTPMDGVLQLVK